MIKITQDFSNALSNQIDFWPWVFLYWSKVMFQDFSPKTHSHQSSFLQQVFVFKVNEGSTYGKYIQVTKMSTTPAYFDHPSVITKMIRLQTMAHICELQWSHSRKPYLHFHRHLVANPKYFTWISKGQFSKLEIVGEHQHLRTNGLC